MKVFIFILTSLVVSSSFPQNQREQPIVEVRERKSIDEVNKGLGHDDTMLRPLNSQNSATLVEKRWKSPVQYSFGWGVGLNAKGVILRALDQFRLKSCIDFKPWDYEEEYYIQVIQEDGCWSYIGRVAPNGQQLSIGLGCDYINTAEHEFLHALGFTHEHNRFDRDDYVTINFTNIIKGMENNFEKAPKFQYTTYGTQYDYWSVMHYGKNSFSNGNGTTIIPTNPKYLNIIGHFLDMSPTDAQELNLHYQCNTSVAFMLHCDFSNDMACPVTNCSNSPMTWQKVTQAIGGPSSDHTSLSTGSLQQGSGYFMHVSTAYGEEGDSAWLETKRMNPKRACHIKCLQFYYYHTKSESNDLNIWIREFQDEHDVYGQRHLVERISGPRTRQWQIKYVPLGVTKSFQVEFEVRKGALQSTGGISIDDINLSELECPHATLQINNFRQILNYSELDYTVYSPLYYSIYGYRYSFGVTFERTFFGLFVQLVSGKYDNNLTWPVPDHQVTLQMVDQSPHIQNHMSMEISMTSDYTRANGNGSYLWGRPEDHGSSYVDEYNETVYYGPKIGFKRFATLDELKWKNLLKGGNAVFNIFFQDVSPLRFINELPCPLFYNNTHDKDDNGPCFPKTTTTQQPKTTTHSTKTTKDKSVFGFAPSRISSPALTLLALLMLLMH